MAPVTLYWAPRSTWIQEGSGRPRPWAQRVVRLPSTARSTVVGLEYDEAVTVLPCARSPPAGMVTVTDWLAGDSLPAASRAVTVKVYVAPAVRPDRRTEAPLEALITLPALKTE